MGIFKIFRRETPGVVNDGTGADGNKVKGADYKQNVVYVQNAEQAMKIAAVYRAVNLISSSAAVLTLQYKRRDRANDYFKIFDTGDGEMMNYLLSVRPNSRMNSFTFVKYMVAQVLLQGNAFVLPRRDSFGKIYELILCTPGSVSYDLYANRYVVSDTVNGIAGVFEAEEVIHIKNACTNGGYWGVSTITYAAQTLGIAATSDSETLKRFATGGRFKAVLQNNTSVVGFGEYQDKQLDGLAGDLNEALKRGDDILSLRGDGQLTPISMSSTDMQFLESRKFTIREIARFFNVPPSKLMDDSNANYKSVEVSNIAFYAEALQPIITEIEREFSAKLLSARTYKDYKYCFDLSKLYALDLDSKAKWDKARLDNGQASVNDLRRESDKAPVEKGEEVYLSVNLAPIGSDKLRGGLGTENGGNSTENGKNSTEND